MKHPLLLLLCLVLLQGCIAAAAGGIAATGYLGAQERTIGDAVDDTTIWAKIKEAYVKDDAKKLLVDINVEVIEARVHLTGTVKDPQTKVDAVRLAWQVPGVKEVINEIQLIDPDDNQGLSYFAKDNWIGTQLRTKLIFNKDIRYRNYSIEVVRGIVYLMGIAASEDELNSVTNIASTISGVQKVVSYVRILSR